MHLDASLIGRTGESREFEIEKGAIRKFAEAIGDNNRLCFDEDYAKSLGFASLVAPPTFPTTFRVPMPDVRLDLSHVLHGEQEYAYHRPITAGDVIRCKNCIVDVYEREGRLGNMTFLVTEVVGEDLGGNPVFSGKSTIIIH